MLGHISSAYTAKVSRDLAVSTRFDFNVYSFESEWTMGAEWWLRKPPPETSGEERDDSIPVVLPKVSGVIKARASTNNVSGTFYPLGCTLNL